MPSVIPAFELADIPVDTGSPMRGILIAAPASLALWIGLIAAGVRLF